MKKFILVFASLFSVNAFAADLVKIVYQPGFEMTPKQYVVTLDDAGLAKADIRTYRENTEVLGVELATLAPDVVAKIAASVAKTDLSKALVDLQEGEPMCTDTPMITVLVVKDGVEKEVFKTHSCHEFRIEENYHLYSVVRIAEGLLNLAQL